MSADGQGLQRFRDRSRSADLDDAIDAAAIGQFARLLIPIRRLGIIDYLGGPQRLRSLGLFRGRARRDHSGAQKLGELQRKDRNAPRTLRQNRVAGGYWTVSGQRHPGGHRGAWQGRGFLKRDVAWHRYESFLAQY